MEGSKPKLKNDLWKYSMPTMSWKLMQNGTAEVQDSVPGSRQLAAGCGLLNTYFVLFGGLGSEEKVLGDTWIFYQPDSMWYTLEGLRSKVSASNATEGNRPSARGDMAVWCTGDEMIVFGGFNEKNGLHHDLWRFSLLSLSWEESDSSAKLPADHEFVKHLNYPDGRSGATTWVSGDRLFMFGGNIMENNLRSKHMMIGNVGDLWEYSKQQDTWIYHTGSQTVCKSVAKYGELGSDLGNYSPSCRRRAASWVDSLENLWLFGGDGIDSSQASFSVFSHSKLLSDIWYYSLKTNKWTWKGGETKGDQKGKFGKKGQKSKNNLPGSRCEGVFWSVWNYFYLFGGVGHDGYGKDGYLNDIWKLDVHLDEVVISNSPTAGPVFAMIFFSLGLVILISILYMFSRRYFQTKSDSNKGKYSRLPIDAEQ